MMGKKKISYIDFDVFVNNSGVKESTIKRNYKQIPGVIKDGKQFRVVSGTRYPYRLRGANIEDHGAKCYTLLKAISKYKYISHSMLGVEQQQFEDMLKELLIAKLIKPNNLSNSYGANAYDSTLLGDDFIKRTDKAAKNDFINTIAQAAGTFTGAILSQVYEVA